MKLMHPDSKQEIDVAASVADRYKAQGWREIAADAPDSDAPLTEWRKYARSLGFTADDIKGKTRTELRAALA